MSYPYNLQTKTITGNFAYTFFDKTTGEYRAIPREGFVYVTPVHSEIKVLNPSVMVDLYELQRQKVQMNNGTFSVEVLVTDQPGISPAGGWSYKFEMSWMDGYEANIPITSDLSEVIDINDYFDIPETPGIIVTKGDPGEDGQDGEDGRSIVSVTSNGPIATIEYSDGTTSTFRLPDSEGGGSYQWIHEQSASQSDWVVEHNLNKYITGCYVIYGTANLGDPNVDQVLANWSNLDLNTIVIHHGNPCSGKAVLN